MTKRAHSPGASSSSASSFYAPFNPYEADGNVNKKILREDGETVQAQQPHITTQAMLRPESVSRMTTKSDNIVKYETPSCERLVYVPEKDANGNTKNQKDYQSASASPQPVHDHSSPKLTPSPNPHLANLEAQIAQAQVRQNREMLQNMQRMTGLQQQMQQNGAQALMQHQQQHLQHNGAQALIQQQQLQQNGTQALMQQQHLQQNGAQALMQHQQQHLQHNGAQALIQQQQQLQQNGQQIVMQQPQQNDAQALMQQQQQQQRQHQIQMQQRQIQQQQQLLQQRQQQIQQQSSSRLQQPSPESSTPKESSRQDSQVQDSPTSTMQSPTGKSSSPNYYCSTKDTMYTKLFVGGLPYHTTDKTLREHFEQYGDIDEAVVILDKSTDKSRGYGFVTMSDREGAQRAVANPNPVIDGRKANVNLAFLGAKQRAGPTIDYPASLQNFLALKAAGWPNCGFVQAGQSTPQFPATAGFAASPYQLPLYYPGIIPYQTAATAPSTVSPGSTAANQQFWDYTALANAQATESAAAQLAQFPYMTAAAAAATNPALAAAAQQQAVSPMSYAYIPATAQTMAAQAAYQSQQLASSDQLH